jgi:hypothetical protein
MITGINSWKNFEKIYKSDFGKYLECTKAGKIFGLV